ncbi:MAG: universal stress protein [Acidimicrobiia bacterium]|nr:universal stress protein [Acidimicrobiia bacterium]
MKDFRIKRILFPVDFSDRSDGAAHYVEALTGRFQAELILLHVVETPSFLFGGPESYGAATLNKIREDRLVEANSKLNQYLGAAVKHFDVKRALVEGEPAHQIITYAHDNPIDLIMMPSHGFGPFRRFVIGSVTAKVLHDAHCPVWTGVHLEEAPPLEQIHCRHIVCAIDLGPQSEATVKWASSLAREYGAQLTVAHATPEVEAFPARYMDSEFAALLASRAREQVAELTRKAGVNCEIWIGSGNPAEAIRAAATESKADLVVIARGALAAGIGRLRTHAYAIIRNSPCPVVSV